MTGTDSISKKAAIDAVRNIRAITGTDDDSILLIDKAEAMTELMCLPSAQTEPLCNTCRYRNLEWDEEPCDSCTMGGESNYYKPSAQPDMSEYSDRLWKAAYERGKREAQPERKKGKWSEAERQKSQIFYCSVCGGRVYYPWIGSRKEKRKNVCRYAYCPYCNADMRGEQP